MEILLLIAISIPIFYVWGIISFIRNIVGKDEDKEFRKRFIHELSAIAKETPTKQVQTIVSEYKEKLDIKQEFQPTAEVTTKEEPVKTHQREEKESVNLQWQNWYSNNSINLLLYLGAFLIVTSASIFVSFQWETISGITKASLLSSLTIIFFVFGIWFYSIPKIKNAGATFIAIGGLLIPLCGAAWYNFVLKEQGIESGIVWMVTSILSLFVYIVLAKKLENTFFAYVSTMSALSFSLSSVRVFHVASDFYILASLFTSIVLYITASRLPASERKVFSTPLNLSSNILMPITLIYGLFVAISDGRLFTAEAVLSIILGVWFYILAYTLEKTVWKLAVGLLLLPFGLLLFAKWQVLPDVIMLTLSALCGLGYVFVSPVLQEKQLREESDLVQTIGIFVVVMTFLGSVILDVHPQAQIFFALCGMLAGVYSAYHRKQIVYTGVSSIFLAISLFILHNEIFHLSEFPHYLGLTYTGIGLVYYGLLVNWKRHKSFIPTAGLSSGLFLLLGLIFSSPDQGTFTFVSATVAIVFFVGSMEFAKPQLIYASNAFVYLTLFSFLNYRQTNPFLFPIYFSILPFALYGISISIEKSRKELALAYRYSALVGALFTPILSLFNTSRLSYTYSSNIYERNMLISAYTATILYIADAYNKKQSWTMYAASGIGMVTYLWQMRFLDVSEPLLYIIPIGVYFLALAYTRRLLKDSSTGQGFDYLGIFFLIVIPFLMSLGGEMKYSLVLLAEGLAFIGLGNSLSYKLYRYAGFAAVILAVLPQTYEYVLALPRWLLVGLIGVVLLGTAIALLLRRNDSH